MHQRPTDKSCLCSAMESKDAQPHFTNTKSCGSYFPTRLRFFQFPPGPSPPKHLWHSISEKQDLEKSRTLCTGYQLFSTVLSIQQEHITEDLCQV